MGAKAILKNKFNTKIVSVIITILVIGLLFFSGPASAVTVGTDNYTTTAPEEGTNMTFLAKMDIHTNDVIDAKNITMNITDGTSESKCTFDLDGEILGTCADYFINSCNFQSTYAATAGYGYGYGYNGSTTTVNITASAGYGKTAGYGYATYKSTLNSGATNAAAELVCNLTWTAPTVTSDTIYTVNMQVEVGTSGYYFSDANDPQTITVLDLPTGAQGKEVDVAVGASGNVTFSNTEVSAIIAKISGLTAGWAVNATVYNNTIPSGWPTIVTPLSFFEIVVNDTSAGGNYTIYFNASSATMTSAGLIASDVKLWVNETAGWTALTTSVVDSSTDPQQFSAWTTHFSAFAAAGSSVTSTTSSGPGGGGGGGSLGGAVTTPSEAVEGTEGGTPTPPAPGEGGEAPVTEAEGSSAWWIVLLIIVVLIVVIALVMKGKKKEY